MVFHVQRTQQSRQVIQDAEWPLQFGWQLQLNRPHGVAPWPLSCLSFACV
jgi:hypothetical protein